MLLLSLWYNELKKEIKYRTFQLYVPRKRQISHYLCNQFVNDPAQSWQLN